MINLLSTLPRKLTVAVSGGVDSMALFDFLSRNHDVKAAFVHHGTENSERAYQFLMDTLTNNDLTVYKIDENRPKDTSCEEHWRNERYKFFSTLGTVVTAHTLDDVAETWIWSSLNGCSSLIPYRHSNVIRPILTTRKAELIDWANRKSVKWIEDTSNLDTRYTRNYIRHELMSKALHVNPGLHSMLKKKLIERHTEKDKQCLTNS